MDIRQQYIFDLSRDGKQTNYTLVFGYLTIKARSGAKQQVGVLKM